VALTLPQFIIYSDAVFPPSGIRPHCPRRALVGSRRRDRPSAARPTGQSFIRAPARKTTENRFDAGGPQILNGLFLSVIRFERENIRLASASARVMCLK
jgi:hypothetical protein